MYQRGAAAKLRRLSSLTASVNDPRRVRVLLRRVFWMLLSVGTPHFRSGTLWVLFCLHLPIRSVCDTRNLIYLSDNHQSCALINPPILHRDFEITYYICVLLRVIARYYILGGSQRVNSTLISYMVSGVGIGLWTPMCSEGLTASQNAPYGPYGHSTCMRNA